MTSTTTTPTTFVVCSLTERGGISYRYEGTDGERANKLYTRLEAQNKPRLLYNKESGQHLRKEGMGF